MTIAIRVARSSDAGQLVAVEQSAAQVFASVPDLEWIADDHVMTRQMHLDAIARGTVWVAADAADTAVGFVSGERVAGTLHIGEASVVREMQGQGIGRRLFAAAVHWARDVGLQAITLTTFRAVAWNEPFYQSLGFVTLGEHELDDRLAMILANEVAAGLPRERRCAMRLQCSAFGLPASPLTFM